MRETIEYKGIQRNASDINCIDGACEEVINARNKNGAWRPVGVKQNYDPGFEIQTDTEKVYLHPVKNNNFIFINQTKLFTAISRNTDTGYENILQFNPADEEFVNISHLNSILIITTTKNVYKFNWDYDDYSYNELEDVPIPLMHFEQGEQKSSYIDPMPDLSSMVAEIHSRLSSAKEQGYRLGHTFFRFAYKLYDGSYIKHSNLYYVALGNKTSNKGLERYVGNYSIWESIRVKASDSLKVATSIEGVVFTAFANYIYKYSTEQKNILKKYKGIIKSLCIFSSNPESYYNDITNNPDNWDGIGWIESEMCYYDVPFFKSTQDYGGIPYGGDTYEIFKHKVLDKTDIVDNTINFYKIKEIDLNTLIDSDMDSPKNLKFPEHLETKETLSVDNFTHHNVWGKTNYNYNSRLHFGNITTQLFSGFNHFAWAAWEDGSLNVSSYNYLTRTFLKTEQGEKIVIEYTNNPYFTYINDIYLHFNRILAYPDSRAYKIQFMSNYSGSYRAGSADAETGDMYYEFNLTPHPFLNFSYYCFDLATESLEQVDETKFTGGSFTLTESRYLTDKNRLQASLLDNPLVYMAENSYQIGTSENEIIGMAAATEPLSEGQHGQFPLYVFTTQGIKALAQGNTGDILYSNIIDLNGEVCNNADSILSVKGGVAFTTEKGLKLLSGRDVIHISLPAEGEPKDYLKNDSSYESYLNSEYLVDLFNYIGDANLLDYLALSVIAYDNMNNEILISNSSKKYIWVYNIDSQSWYKRTDIQFDQVINIYPSYLGYNTNGTFYDLSSENEQYLPVLIQTRPIKLKTNNRKRIDRIVQRCNLNVKELTKSGFYVFGSIDGNSYSFMRGVQPDADGTFFDILVKRIPASVRYIIIVFAGQLKDSEITSLEIDFEEKYSNKLRI
jgi:hypothetical protein